MVENDACEGNLRVLHADSGISDWKLSDVSRAEVFSAPCSSVCSNTMKAHEDSQGWRSWIIMCWGMNAAQFLTLVYKPFELSSVCILHTGFTVCTADNMNHFGGTRGLCFKHRKVFKQKKTLVFIQPCFPIILVKELCAEYKMPLIHLSRPLIDCWQMMHGDTGVSLKLDSVAYRAYRQGLLLIGRRAFVFPTMCLDSVRQRGLLRSAPRTAPGVRPVKQAEGIRVIWKQVLYFRHHRREDDAQE